MDGKRSATPPSGAIFSLDDFEKAICKQKKKKRFSIHGDRVLFHPRQKKRKTNKKMSEKWFPVTVRTAERII